MNIEQDNNDFEEFAIADRLNFMNKYLCRKYWLAARRTLREKIKADPSIGKLEIEEWPESPDY